MMEGDNYEKTIKTVDISMLTNKAEFVMIPLVKLTIM